MIKKILSIYFPEKSKILRKLIPHSVHIVTCLF